MVSRRAGDGTSANFSLINSDSESIQNNNINDSKEPPPPYLPDRVANDTETAGNQVQGTNYNNPHAPNQLAAARCCESIKLLLIY
jgi:hypothetical protein